jgi:ADP-ribosyl-[dinitrogen reductase] hydrolase
MLNKKDRFRGCLIGLAVGDAVGTTVEFRDRGSFEPLTDMVGGGPFGLEPGQWTDDTSMALCLATSLVEHSGFDAQDQMCRYCAWFQKGYLSSNGRCFDIGITTRQALRKFLADANAMAGSDDPMSAGNGSIMRLAPVPMFFASRLDEAIHFAAESSRTTHGAHECLDACRLLAAILVATLNGSEKPAALFDSLPESVMAESIQRIGRGEYRDKSEAEIRGSGYVVQSLEAALWCFWTTSDFESAILKAANLGDDADTTAAICGQVAGAYYGDSGIPAHWRDRLAHGAMIADLADRLHAMSQNAR